MDLLPVKDEPNMSKEIIDRHHLLEIILWPNGDGTFRTILNSRKRLKDLGIYDDFKMTIPLTREEHTRLHATGERNPMYGRNRELSGMYGKKHSEETKKKMSESRKSKSRTCPTYGMYGKKHSDETRKKMSDSQKGERNPMYGKPSAMKGKHHSEKTRQKMREAWARRNSSNK